MGPLFSVQLCVMFLCKKLIDVLVIIFLLQDIEAKCVTDKSSVELIHKLYEIVALTEVEALVVLLYTQDLQEKLENRK